MLLLSQALGVIVCVLLTGAAMVAPEYGWLQLLASLACGAFAWAFGRPPGTVLSAMLARMRPERLAQVVTQAAASMPPEAAARVLNSLQPPAAAPVAFEPPERPEI